jgi:hypothetical protein
MTVFISSCIVLIHFPGQQYLLNLPPPCGIPKAPPTKPPGMGMMVMGMMMGAMAPAKAGMMAPVRVEMMMMNRRLLRQGAD